MKSILERIKPKKEELDKIKEILKYLNSKIKIKDAKLELGGSGAKNTNLSGSHDVDIFIKFNYNQFKDQDISKILEKNIKHLKPTKLHGSRDYFQLKYNSYLIELVPILEITKSSQAKNITDISPLHTKYVKKHSKLVDQIRLTKAFAKAQDCYGAESYIRGFSGYVLEILTIHYGSFKNLVKNVAKWRSKVIIDPTKTYKNPLIEMNASKTESPLILIDPVDKTRNTAAALSIDKFNLIIKSAQKYQQNPSEKFFIQKEKIIPKNSYILEAIPLQGKEDVIGAKLVKILNYIKKQSELEGYKITTSDWSWKEKAKFWFKVKSDRLEQFRIRKGPFKDDLKNVQRFRKANKKIYLKGKNYYAKIPRKHKNYSEFIQNLIKDPNIKDNVKSIKLGNI